MMKAHSPGTCVDFFAFIKNYCDEWDLKVLCITPNNDDTLTVLFSDQTTKRYKCEDGNWIEIPLELGDSGGTCGVTAGSSSIPAGYLPPGISIG